MKDNSLVTMLQIGYDNGLGRLGEAYAAFAALAAPLSLNKLHKEMAEHKLVYKEPNGQYEWYFDSERKSLESIFAEVTGQLIEKSKTLPDGV